MHNAPQFMHNLLLSATSLQMAGRVEIAQGRDVQLHQHPLVELVYYLEGSVQCHIGAEVVACRPGMLRVMPPGVAHGELSLTTWACYCIWIDMSTALVWPSLYIDDTHGTLGQLCRMLVAEWNGQAPDRDEMLGVVLHQVDLLLRRAHSQHSVAPAEQLVREAERLLNERFTTPMTTGAIALALGVSPSYLRAQFVRLRGQTLMAHLQALRVQHALALIRNSSLCLEAIAKLCGYDSSSHLSRCVKRATGERPGTFRSTPRADSTGNAIPTLPEA